MYCTEITACFHRGTAGEVWYTAAHGVLSIQVAYRWHACKRTLLAALSLTCSNCRLDSSLDVSIALLVEERSVLYSSSRLWGGGGGEGGEGVPGRLKKKEQEGGEGCQTCRGEERKGVGETKGEGYQIH